jgi:hypothetical protein
MKEGDTDALQSMLRREPHPFDFDYEVEEEEEEDQGGLFKANAMNEVDARCDRATPASV